MNLDKYMQVLHGIAKEIRNTNISPEETIRNILIRLKEIDIINDFEVDHYISLFNEKMKWYCIQQNKEINNIIKEKGKEIKRLRKALRFYAEPSTWEEELVSNGFYDDDGVCIEPPYYEPPLIYYDNGKVAREALENIGKNQAGKELD